MTFPGSNILNRAQSLINPTEIQFYRFTGRNTNDVGQDVTSYASPVTIKANVQRVARSRYQRMGLDYTRRYIRIWASTDLDDIYRNTSGDQIDWEGGRYQLLNSSDWIPIDGWNSLLAIEVER